MDFETRVMQKLAEIDARLQRIEEALLAQREEAPRKRPREALKSLLVHPLGIGIGANSSCRSRRARPALDGARQAPLAPLMRLHAQLTMRYLSSHREARDEQKAKDDAPELCIWDPPETSRGRR